MSKTRYEALQPIETKLKDDAGKNKTFWNRVGSAFVNNDGSINVKLNALPVDGEFQLRLPKDK